MIKITHDGLLKAILNHAQEIPEKAALIVNNIPVTYKELTYKIMQTAVFLQQKGLKRGDTIILTAKNDVEFVYVYFAAHLLGIINIVTDPKAKTDKIQYIISLTQPKYIFGHDEELVGVTPVPFKDLDYSGNATSLNLPALSKDDTGDVMFTTGTTSNPKGVCLSYYNITSASENQNAFIHNTKDDIEILGLPLNHAFAIGRMRCNLLAGATIIMLGSLSNLALFFKTIERYHATGFTMVPSLWTYIKRLSGHRIGKYAPQIKYMELGTAPMSVEDKQELIELFPDTRIVMNYGLTEAMRSFFCEFHEIKENLNTIGRPSNPEKVFAKICDENGNEMPAGEPGELCVKGNMVMQRYLLDEENDKAWFGDYFRTGDFAYHDEKGLYYFVGRKKELINIGGEKVSPITIEEAIMSLNLVKDCAAVALADKTLGEVPKVYLVAKDKQDDRIIEDIKSKMPDLLQSYQLPRAYAWIDDIPKTGSGKVQRLLLK